MNSSTKMKRKFRPEIEGLRSVAAILVAVYHIWFGNISGGVDIFFVVSGFLITTSLLNMYEKKGKVDGIEFLLRLGKRLFPVAFSVLIFVVISGFYFLPQTQWDVIIEEVWASMLYMENWQLASNSVDYLAQNNVVSPVQHFWAMGTQFQFYIIWTIVLIALSVLAKKSGIPLKKLLFPTIIVMFLLSLSYSIYITAINQPWAYFDTFARVWEFATGSILSLIIVKITFNKVTNWVIGWLGLFGLISCGLILQVGTMFPGYAALWPVMAAVLILVAGESGGRFGVHRLLSAKPLVKFGSISYGFYLWHWPLLVIYYNIFDSESIPVFHGLLIMVLAAISSFLTTILFEKPIRKKKINSKAKLALILFVIAFPVIILTGSWTWYLKDIQSEAVKVEISNTDHPGAYVMVSDVEFHSDEPFIPKTANAKYDFPESYKDGCHQEMEKSEVIMCEYGEVDTPDYTIALVGGSHSAHWLAPLENYANENNIKILNYTRSACRFSSESYLLTTKLDQQTCAEWNDGVMKELIAKEPDLVFTTADATEWKGIPKGYVDQWETLDDNDINIFAIKDNPRADFDIPTCVEKNGVNANECELKNDLEDLTKNIKKLDIDNIYYADLTGKFCEKEICKPVIGNVLVYQDDSHLTKTYAETLTPFLGEELTRALNHFYR
ncbi:Peptidoglycan/LPS O-acetylase OafA/YrhL, contains acyltransferase and SGNH-hydrolase domains [Gracilibacillus ureilyticus]|uniref:Peptidoglycan/LPS O-acetylase OafA/YrhL, contains acyltransferase and SGNH-hydrolase domains n=1 Tax=Gracilibacillus ureilyticus TaxID=531814 RepID=A0A1H9TZ09_9BACI|nr:acyltransferase family protein [Gracilibacillus ureilyticus]SES01983.1 Peptidoglycan/LPS O-acetylase OafA/YrhL, contains acyltransferase and SGNH-hydrolase domains [Gracilibacillus ureilyticus]